MRTDCPIDEPFDGSGRLGRRDHEHLVQLFDTEESRVQAVVDFFMEGFAAGDVMLAVIDEHRWYSVAMRLAASGIPLDESLDSGQLLVREAESMLSTFLTPSGPDRNLFMRSVGGAIRRLARDGQAVRVYGEMVDVLAAQGDYRAALRLEQLWGELQELVELALFCGYGSTHFGDPQHAEALRRICDAHSRVVADSTDILGSFLLTANRIAPDWRWREDRSSV